MAKKQPLHSFFKKPHSCRFVIKMYFSMFCKVTKQELRQKELFNYNIVKFLLFCINNFEVIYMIDFKQELENFQPTININDVAKNVKEFENDDILSLLRKLVDIKEK